MREQIAKAVERVVGRLGSIVWMDPDCGIEKRIAVGKPDSRLQIRRALARADGHQPIDSRRAGPLDHRFPIRRKLLVVKMAMRVDQLHFSRAPTGTSSR